MKVYIYIQFVFFQQIIKKSLDVKYVLSYYRKIKKKIKKKKEKNEKGKKQRKNITILEQSATIIYDPEQQ